jgi:hypothetical protein
VKVTLDATKEEAAAVLEMIQAQFPAAKSVAAIHGADAKIELDLLTPAGPVRAEIAAHVEPG